jgi:DNA-binding NtrC family response regulator
MISSAAHPFVPRIEPKADERTNQASSVPTIVMATVDPEIRQNMGELLEGCTVNTRWATGIEEIRTSLAREDVAAVFCGFWLVDGTYRDVIRHLKSLRADVPVVIVCSPACSQEYRDYLAALNIRAFDFICYPYRRVDLERILDSAIALRTASLKSSTPVTESPDRSLESSGLRQAS